MPPATPVDLRAAIVTSLAACASMPLRSSAAALLHTLGYRSDRTLAVPGSRPESFLELFTTPGSRARFDQKKALFADWLAADLLFQLTDDEVRSATASAATPEFAFDSTQRFDDTVINSFLFLALELSPRAYTRTELADTTRALNRLFDMPALLLFRHGDTLSLGVIHRRLHKRDGSRDVLEKVTLIKDIHCTHPHRAHLEILADLALPEIIARRPCEKEVTSFAALHEAWRKILDIQALNRRFFTEIRNWFYWARLHSRFPDGAVKDADGRDSEALIRLLTRLIFSWFLREKSLLPDALFSPPEVARLLADWSAADADRDNSGRYYKAILQNLFFATLATPVEERRFRSARSFQGKNSHHGDQRFFRHLDLFVEKAPVEELYKRVPFLNGGLFECLDEIPGRDPDVTVELRIDGFSDVAKKQPLVPDFLFFGDSRPVPDLGPLLGEKGEPPARGLLRIFRDYKFTIEENTPLEEDIALDPELLGRVFENLLAAVNPETGATARKSTGSFYTPREIVHYMVEECLVRRLLAAFPTPASDLEPRLRELVSESHPGHRLTPAETATVIAILGTLKVLDPACGSGAFPMGLLHLLVHVLRQLDPGNTAWKSAKLTTLPDEMRHAAEKVFAEESFDYARKLELIKDCIHGVDIQPTAIQITKLRFFLSLVIEQHDPARVRPLPNLETKFVCANALLGLPRPAEWELFQHQIEPRERELLSARGRYFFAADKKQKDACKAEDRRLRRELAAFITTSFGDSAAALASAVAAWDPYKADRRAHYFDPESMFGLREGFDLTVGNPPYVRADEPSAWNQDQRTAILASGLYETLWEKWDLYLPFVERAYKLLRPHGVSALIISDAFCHAKYAQKSHAWFLQHARVLRLDFCAGLQIFEAAVHNVIPFFQKAPGADWSPDRRVHREAFGEVTLLPTDAQARLTLRAFFPEDRPAVAYTCTALPLETVCYISKGMVVHADEKEHVGAFKLEDLVSETRDKRHPHPFVEGKHLERWLPREHRWLEWGTRRAPSQFSRPTFPELYAVPEKIFIHRTGGENLRCAFDTDGTLCNHTIMVCLPWLALRGVRNNSLKKAARYDGEKPPRPDLPRRELLEAQSRRFPLKFILAIMNSEWARNYLRTNRRSNTDLYPEDWKQLPIPCVSAEQQAPLIANVEAILAAKRSTPPADLAALEAENDRLVAALYALPPEPLPAVIPEAPPSAPPRAAAPPPDLGIQTEDELPLA